MTGKIYFISAPECARIKIGYSSSVATRFRALQSASPVELTLLAAADATANIEKAVHHKFIAYRAKDEWFRSHKALLDFIDKIAAGKPIIPLLNKADLTRRRMPRVKPRSTVHWIEREIRNHFAKHYQ